MLSMVHAAGQAEIEGFASLVLRLRGEGITDKHLLTAVEQTPRSAFAPIGLTRESWSPRLLPIECGTFLEGADLMARLLALLDVQKGHRVLEIGTGSGFATAVMARMADRVVTIERYRTLITLAQQRLAHFGLRNVAFKHADGRQGAPGEGTFDRIFVAGAFETMPRQFVEHLASDGVMLAGIVKDGRTVLARFSKIGNRFDRTDSFELPYLPLVPGVAAIL